jgi:glycosyltransferase involved in cell wall biosynthesis
MLRPHDRVAVCAVMKNEGPYLGEWVAHYRLLGFDRILVYDNESTDQSASILAALQERGVLEAISWPSRDHANPQTAAYEDGLNRVRDDCDWVLFIDADEFLVLKQHQEVWEFTEEFDASIGRIVVNWLCFGSSERSVQGTGLVTERFRLASWPSFEANAHVKSFARPRLVTGMGVHAPLTRGGTVRPCGIPVDLRDETFTREVDLSVAQVNHYFTKSYTEYLQKARRGQSTLNASAPGKFDKYSDGAFNFHDRNDTANHSASRYVAGIRNQLDEWADWIHPEQSHPSP